MDLPTNWIKRDLEVIFRSPQQLGPFKAVLLLGPRQVGKSSLLKKCLGANACIVNLDELDTRTLASSDPVLFARNFFLPLLIDEIQYAPQLLSAIKVLADQSTSQAQIFITGSQSFEVMKGVQESLAGRVVILNLLGLSLAEKNLSDSTPPDLLFKEFMLGSFPALRTFEVDTWARFMSSYVQTYIERDVAELLGIQKRREFEIFLKLCALRTGQLINYQDLAKDAGVSPSTAKDWISLLEDSYLIKTIHPFSPNRSKRLVKTPKLYFLDTGLCSYLAGWRDSEQIRLGPWAGALFETAILGEILRHHYNQGIDIQVHFWRTRDGEEVDFIVESSRGLFPIEVKIGMPQSRDLVPHHKLTIPNLSEGAVISLASPTHKGKLLATDWRYQGILMDWMR